MRSMNKILILFFCCILLCPPSYSKDVFKCTKVIDGDTLQISNGRLVRLIGVDTPEFFHPTKPKEYFTEESKKFLKKMVEGKKITLDYGGQTFDKYRRMLAYVFLPNGTFVNAEIIKRGYGYVYTYYPFKYADKFREYEDKARREKLGLWKDSGAYEMKWLLKQDRKPFEVFNMTNNTWGVRYNSYVKTRLNDQELIDTLKNLHIWINESSPSDLSKMLFEDGWVEGKDEN